MNQRKAKRLACRLAATVLESGVGTPEQDEAESPADYDRLERAWDEIVQELFERGRRS